MGKIMQDQQIAAKLYTCMLKEQDKSHHLMGRCKSFFFIFLETGKMSDLNNRPLISSSEDISN